MDKISREIFRFWNINREKNLLIPTPYRISEFLGVLPKTVYKSWDKLFSTGFIQKIILIPSDKIARREHVLVTSINNCFPIKIIGSIKKTYFLEMLHAVHIYYTQNVPAPIDGGRSIYSLEVINSSRAIALDQAVNIMNGIASNDDMLIAGERKYCAEKLDNITGQIISAIAYKDLYKIKFKEIADKLNVSPRTISRKFEDIMLKGYLVNFPILDQSKLSGYNIFVSSIFNTGITSPDELLDKLSGLSMAYGKYLFYQFATRYINILFYYKTMEELDTIIVELGSLFSSIIISTRFSTYFNDNVILDM